MSADEITHIYDTDGNVTGTMSREEAEAANEIISNVLVFLFDTAGQVWIQLRPQDKKNFPGVWDISVCGGIKHDETPEAAAIREVQEETGLEPDLTFVEAFMNHVAEGHLRRSNLFIGITDDVPKPNPEVDEFRSFHHDELRKLVEANPELYVPSFSHELDKAVIAYRNLAAA